MIWFKAILAGVLTPPLLGAIYYFYLSYGSDAPFNRTVFFITIFFSYWLVALVGIPAVVAFKAQSPIQLRPSIFAGALVALVTAFLLFALSGMLPPLSQLIVFSFLGVIAGVIVWYVFR